MAGKWFDVKITSNIDQLLNEVLRFNNTLIKLPELRVSVWSELEYAIYTEFGTHKMAPHAMVRNSIPNIEAYFDAQWTALPLFFTEQELTEMMDRVVDYAKDEIVRRTHELSGDLKESWKTDKMGQHD